MVVIIMLRVIILIAVVIIIVMIIINLVNVWTQVPFSTSHRRTVESKLAEART